MMYILTSSDTYIDRDFYQMFLWKWHTTYLGLNKHRLDFHLLYIVCHFRKKFTLK